MSHIGVVDTTTIGREEYMAHGLYLNSRGKRKLMLLIADRLDGSHLSGVSSIPAIVHDRTLLFFRIKTKSQRHLTHIDANYWNFINHDKNLDLSNSLNIFHQKLGDLEIKVKN
jgi:hypothetical protein